MEIKDQIREKMVRKIIDNMLSTPSGMEQVNTILSDYLDVESDDELRGRLK